MEPADPPRKNYALKSREFERVNAPAGTQAKSAEHDIPAILQQNRTVEKQAGFDEIELKVVKSRRKRDYWLPLITGNLATVGLVALGGFNPVSLVYGLAGVVVLSLGLTWIMWFVMDDY